MHGLLNPRVIAHEFPAMLVQIAFQFTNQGPGERCSVIGPEPKPVPPINECWAYIDERDLNLKVTKGEDTHDFTLIGPGQTE